MNGTKNFLCTSCQISSAKTCVVSLINKTLKVRMSIGILIND